MANLKAKDINKLETWDAKELRKLRITIKNRLQAFGLGKEPKDLSASHPLFEKQEGQCKELLLGVQRAERVLSKS
jgi:hypothetical protein